ncbi:hypothetical protein O1611_g4886 [Lasiodiplodia mahajangana]|uniref:Uncharacterized protein n=1 Tax=Lasiodiplodia mahajangana TaxID=1108764 RepID=A0ACC2JMQ2_9PEZI|nr:hypothetical protein O1611_g4886 [Lasiodiplodia mahajangana]
MKVPTYICTYFILSTYQILPTAVHRSSDRNGERQGFPGGLPEDNVAPPVSASLAPSARIYPELEEAKARNVGVPSGFKVTASPCVSESAAAVERKPMSSAMSLPT